MLLRSAAAVLYHPAAGICDAPLRLLLLLQGLQTTIAKLSKHGQGRAGMHICANSRCDGGEVLELLLFRTWARACDYEQQQQYPRHS